MNPPAPAGEIAEATRAEIHALLPTVVARAPGEAASMLDHYPADFVAQMLASLNPALAQSVLERFKIERRQKIIAAARRRFGSNGSGTKGIRKMPSVT